MEDAILLSSRYGCTIQAAMRKRHHLKGNTGSGLNQREMHDGHDHETISPTGLAFLSIRCRNEIMPIMIKAEARQSFEQTDEQGEAGDDVHRKL